jgi:hypothetical protein
MFYIYIAGGGGGGHVGNNVEHKFERLFKTAENAMTSGNFAEAEQGFIEALDVLEEIPELEVAQMLENVLCTKVAVACEKQGKFEVAEKYYLR